jgi:hypothetical protein
MRSNGFWSRDQSGGCLWPCVIWANLALSWLCKYLIICCSAIARRTSLAILSIGIRSTCTASVPLEDLYVSTFYSCACFLSVIDSCARRARNTITCFVYSSVATALWLLTTLSIDWGSGVTLASSAPSVYSQVRKFITGISNALISIVVGVCISWAWSTLVSSEYFVSFTFNGITS